MLRSNRFITDAEIIIKAFFVNENKNCQWNCKELRGLYLAGYPWGLSSLSPIPRDANLKNSKSRTSPFLPCMTLKMHQISKTFPQKMPKVCQNMPEKCILCTFMCVVQNIWWSVWETGRLSMYPGNLQIIQESWHRCIPCFFPYPLPITSIPPHSPKREYVYERYLYIQEYMSILLLHYISCGFHMWKKIGNPDRNKSEDHKDKVRMRPR